MAKQDEKTARDEKMESEKAGKIEMNEMKQYTVRRNIETLVLIGSKLSGGLKQFGIENPDSPEEFEDLMKETYKQLIEMVKQIKAV